MADDPDQPGADPSERLAIVESRASLALAAAGLGEFEWDIEADLFVVSPRMAEITGLPAGPLPANKGVAAYSFVHPEDIEDLSSAVAAGLIREGRYEVRYRMRRPDDGRTLWMYSAAAAVSGPSGRLLRVVGVVGDISDRKAKEDEREALVAELDHRVKNVLTLVQSVAVQSARKTVSLDAFLKTFSGRLEAMAAAHILLTASRWRGADIASIAAAELGGLAPGQARWRGEDLLLSPRATNALTLALHELATNAVKFGALSTEAGRVDVTWRTHAEGGFELDWRERGGPTVSPPSRRGFGSTLLERVTGRELGGEARLEFHPDGVRATMRAGATALAAAMSTSVSPPGEYAADAEGAFVDDGSPASIEGMRILVVEDTALLAHELEAGLIEAGAKVVGVASDLREAEKMSVLAFDAAVLDAHLKGRSVRPIAEALAKQHKPFIFAIGYGDHLDTLYGFQAPIVRKPYVIDQIAAALVQAAGRA